MSGAETAQIFVSCSKSDVRLAEAIAGALRAAGLRTWLYSQNGVPGLKYTQQVNAALSASQALVVILSAEAARSEQVYNEVLQALEDGKPRVPALLGMTHAELIADYPSWRPVIGAIVSVEVRTDDPAPAMHRIVLGVTTALAMSATPAPRSPPPPRPPAPPAVAEETRTQPASIPGSAEPADEPRPVPQTHPPDSGAPPRRRRRRGAYLALAGAAVLGTLAGVWLLNSRPSAGSHPRAPAVPARDSVRDSRPEGGAPLQAPLSSAPAAPVEWQDEGKWIRAGDLVWLKEAPRCVYANIEGARRKASEGLPPGDPPWRLPTELELLALCPLLEAGVLKHQPGDLFWTGDRTQRFTAYVGEYQPGQGYAFADRSREELAYARFVRRISENK